MGAGEGCLRANGGGAPPPYTLTRTLKNTAATELLLLCAIFALFLFALWMGRPGKRGE